MHAIRRSFSLRHLTTLFSGRSWRCDGANDVQPSADFQVVAIHGLEDMLDVDARDGGRIRGVSMLEGQSGSTDVVAFNTTLLVRTWHSPGDTARSLPAQEAHLLARACALEVGKEDQPTRRQRVHLSEGEASCRVGRARSGSGLFVVEWAARDLGRSARAHGGRCIIGLPCASPSPHHHLGRARSDQAPIFRPPRLDERRQAAGYPRRVLTSLVLLSAFQA